MRYAITSLLCIASVSPAVGQSPHIRDNARVREAIRLLEVWADAQRAYEAIPGMSMAVIYDQDVLWSRGFGFADPEAQVPATPSTIYSICSISKLFTSVGVMQLRDEGSLRLDDPVGAHLDWFDIADAYPDAPPVTVEGLLTHASGLPRESDYPYWSPPDFPFPTHEQVVSRLPQQEELYPAFEYFQYSNLGLTLAGELIAARSGRDYATHIHAEILSPLAMTSTTTDIPVAEHGHRMAKGYTAKRRGGAREPVGVFQARGIAPAAGYASTVEDLGRFAAWQFRVLHHDVDEILRRNTLREMHRVHWVDPDWETKWGLGFATWRSDDKTYVGHGGSCPGYRSSFSLDPIGKLAAVHMANASGVDAGSFTTMAHRILGPAISAAADTASVEEPTDPALEMYTGTYDLSPWWGESEVILWKGKLAVVSLPADNPLEALTRLEQTGEHTFRRIRDDDSLGEEIRFDVGPDGTVLRMWQHSNFRPRIPQP
jgi:CubicO group peptidase (beta-lactamase class C family)